MHLDANSPFPPLEQGKVRLYSCALCPYSMRVKLVLAAKKIKFEVVNINVNNPPTWYLHLNVDGHVPTIQFEDGRSLKESLIICEYLEALHPEKSLTPQDPFENAQQRILIDRVHRIREPLFKLLKAEISEATFLMNDKVEEELGNAMDYYEKNMEGKKYFAGDKPGMVDYMLWPFMRIFEYQKVRAQFDIHSEENRLRFQNIRGFIRRMKELRPVRENFVPLAYYDCFFAALSNKSGPNFDIESECSTLLDERDDPYAHSDSPPKNSLSESS